MSEQATKTIEGDQAMNALAKHEPTELQSAEIIESPALTMLQNALTNSDVSAERIDKALEWMERLEAKEALSKFNAAFSQMQQDMPVIPKRGKGHQDARYATLEDIISVSRPVLTKFGFVLNWTNDVDQKSKTLTVTACLRHEAGHSIENTGVYPFDGSGSKNAIQAIGSAQTYGQRYTASGLLGLAMGDADDDGRLAGASAVITDDQVSELASLLSESGADQQKFLEFMKAKRLMDIPMQQFGKAQAMLLRKKAETQGANHD